MTLSRRDILSAAIQGAVGVSIASTGVTTAFARERATPVVATALTDDLLLVSGAGANVVAARAENGILLVDGGAEARSSALLKTVRGQLREKRVQTLFNTHWHPEQTGSNQRLASEDVKIIAHENTKLWLGRRISVAWREDAYGPLPPRARPNNTIYTSATLNSGGDTVEYGYLPQAHTDGDIYVFFRKANVLVAGGVVSADSWPIIDFQTGGWIGGLVAGLNTLIKLADDNTRIVPANGPLLTRKDLESQRDMYMAIYDRLVKSLTKGLGPDEAAAAKPADGYNTQWGDPNAFVLMAFKSLWGHFSPDA